MKYEITGIQNELELYSPVSENQMEELILNMDKKGS